MHLHSPYGLCYTVSPFQGFKSRNCFDFVKKDKKKRFEWLQHAASNGFLEAQEQLAECYEKGRGVNENHVRAYQWYKKAAEQGSEYGKVKAKEFELFKFYK